MIKTLLKIGLLLGALAGIAFGVSLLFPEKHPAPVLKALPNPNGYDRLVEASHLVTGISRGIEGLDQHSLATIVIANSNALYAAREGLKLESQVPVQSSESYMKAHMRDVAGFRSLAGAFSAEHRLAILEGRTSDAMTTALETVGMAFTSSRGGMTIDALIDVAIEAKAAGDLQALLPDLDAPSCRTAAAHLEALENQREPFDSITSREQEWLLRIYSRNLQQRISGMLASRSVTAGLAKAKLRYEERRSEQRQLILQFASRAYELEKGRKPAAAADLVPDYLKALPIDPATGTNMTRLP